MLDEGFSYPNNPEEYIVACLLAPIEGESYFYRWPSHITVIPWFEVLDTEHAIAVMERLGMIQEHFNVTVKHEAAFGPHRNVPVNEVESPELHMVHTMLHGELENVKADLPFEQYSLANYRPHITIKRDKHFAIGDEILIDTLFLIAAPKFEDRRTRRKRVVHGTRLR